MDLSTQIQRLVHMGQSKHPGFQESIFDANSQALAATEAGMRSPQVPIQANAIRRRSDASSERA